MANAAAEEAVEAANTAALDVNVAAVVNTVVVAVATTSTSME